MDENEMKMKCVSSGLINLICLAGGFFSIRKKKIFNLNFEFGAKNKTKNTISIWML